MFKTFLFILKLIWENLENKKINFIFAILNSILIGFILFFTPFFLGKFIDNLNNNDLAIHYFIVFLVLAFGRSILSLIYRRNFEILGELVLLNFLKNYFIKLYNKSYTWHVSNSTPYITSILKRISGELDLSYVKFMHKHIPYIVGIMLFFIYSYNLSIYLLTYFISFIFLIFVMIRISYTRRYGLIKNGILKGTIFDKKFIDFLYNIKTLKKLFIKDYAVNSIKKSQNTLFLNAVKLLNLNAYQWFFVEFMLVLMFAIPIIYYLNFSLNNSGAGLGTIIVIYSIMPMFQEFSREFMDVLRRVSKSRGDLEILGEKLLDINSNDNNLGKENLKSWEKITFENTVHNYLKDKNSFIHKIKDLEINKGEKIAIIGKSGSGKTTFLNIFTNNIQINSGKIKVDKINYKDLSNKFFEQHLIYISQDIELFDMSLKDNILLGKKVKKEELLRILKGVGLDDFLKRIDNDLNILVGEKGIKLSAGERQRINIARGLVMKKNIMVLDEITANLDKKTTKQVWDLIFKECSDRTIIIVSHEDQVLNYVDRVIEFKNGKVI